MLYYALNFLLTINCLLHTSILDEIEIRTNRDLEAYSRAESIRGNACSFYCGNKSCFENRGPLDAKKGNLVFIDPRFAQNEEDVLLGDWESQFQIGVVTNRIFENNEKNTKDPSKILLHLAMYEPYYSDGISDLHPLWAENHLRKLRGDALIPTIWKEVVKMPWRKISQLPLSTTKALMGDPNFKPDKRMLIPDFKGCGVSCVKMHNSTYSDKQTADCVRHVLQFEKGEKNKNTIRFGELTQSAIIKEIFRTDGQGVDDAMYML